MDGPAVKSTSCSCRGAYFYSQHPHGDPQLPVTPVPEELLPISGICGHQALKWYTDPYTSNNKKIIIKIKLV